MSELLAFVILPSRPEFIDFYTDVLVPVLESAGYEAQRAENVFNQQNALKDAVLKIHRANIIVADLTVPSASVLYELGIAQGLLKPTILVTQRMERVPFDLRSYRVLEYSTHYKRIEEFKSKLRDLAEKHKTKLIDYGNPVMDFIPNLVSGEEARKLLQEESRPEPAAEASQIEEPETAPEAVAQAVPQETPEVIPPRNDETVSTAEQTQEVRREPVAESTAEETTEAPERPRILDYALAALQAMERINSGVRRVTEKTDGFAQQLNNHNTNIKAIRARGVSGDPKELREALSAAAVDMEAYTAAAEIETPALKPSWDQLLKSTTDLIAAVSIESSEDREAANLFAGQMQALQLTVNNCVSELGKLKETIARTPNISKNLNRAIIRAEQAINSATLELITGQSYVQRTLNLLQERLNAHGISSQPTSEQ